MTAKLTLDTFLEKYNTRFPNHPYKFDKSVYCVHRTPMEVYCPTHGYFWISPNNLYSGKHCTKCMDERNFKAACKTTEDFVRRARAVHGNKYEYDITIYIKCKSKLNVRCTEHGPFPVTGSNHLKGRGCPDCAECGYRSSRPGRLYFLSHNNLYKIGITNKDSKNRIWSINSKSDYTFKLIKDWYFEQGVCAQKLENLLISELRKNHIQPRHKFDGYTECFYNVDQDKLITRIEELIEEHKWQSSTQPQILEECA